MRTVNPDRDHPSGIAFFIRCRSAFCRRLFFFACREFVRRAAFDSFARFNDCGAFLSVSLAVCYLSRRDIFFAAHVSDFVLDLGKDSIDDDTDDGRYEHARKIHAQAFFERDIDTSVDYDTDTDDEYERNYDYIAELGHIDLGSRQGTQTDSGYHTVKDYFDAAAYGDGNSLQEAAELTEETEEYRKSRRPSEDLGIVIARSSQNPVFSLYVVLQGPPRKPASKVAAPSPRSVL